jgi:hypothetical protein
VSSDRVGAQTQATAQINSTATAFACADRLSVLSEFLFATHTNVDCLGANTNKSAADLSGQACTLGTDGVLDTCTISV